MLQRVLEPEVMDSAAEAHDYDAMDHSAVNRVFVADFLALKPDVGRVLDVGAGTAQIPLQLCQESLVAHVLAIDLAEHMLAVGRSNVQRAQLTKRVQLERIDAKQLPYPDAAFSAVISNSIVHHIPEPARVLAEMVRVAKPGAVLLVRDLLRPPDDNAVQHLVNTYAGDANPHQRQMFEDSLRAALTLAEIRAMVKELGFAPSSVQATSDRHWTWSARK